MALALVTPPKDLLKLVIYTKFTLATYSYMQTKNVVLPLSSIFEGTEMANVLLEMSTDITDLPLDFFHGKRISRSCGALQQVNKRVPMISDKLVSIPL